VIWAQSGPAVKPIQGKKFMKKPGKPGTSPRIGRQSAVPLTTAGHTRSSRAEATCGTTAMAVARLLRKEARSTAGRSAALLQRAGQPPPMSSEPFFACFRVSFSPAE